MAKKAPQKKDPFGYSEMVWAETLDPEYAAVRDELRRVAVSEGALSVKVKEMIVIGILASRGLQYGVAAHMRRAVDFGVAYSVGIRALQELELEGKFKDTDRGSRRKTAKK
jgi:alkylhydroperoxidase/carboxymuconolactone decarboxylase family protein YurZ